VVGGLAALAAVWLSVATAKAARRVPLTDSYMSAWRSILDVLAIAAEGRDRPPAEDEADRLMRQFRAADHQLSAVEASLRVRVFGRAIRSDLNNLLVTTLYDEPSLREPTVWLTVADVPRPLWAACSDEEWECVINSVPFTAMFTSEVWGMPGMADDADGLLRWYFPVVLNGLARSDDDVTAPNAAPQRQLAFMLGAYVNSFVLPWIRDATREALMARLGWRGQVRLWQDRLRRWRYDSPWRPLSYSGPTLFEPTARRFRQPK